MMYIAIGIPLLLLFMMMVMGVPLIYYLKRDHAYEAAKGQPEGVRIKTGTTDNS